MRENRIKTVCVRMAGPEKRMDQRGAAIYVTPINPLPIKCSYCTFPDLDFVARPYLLAKGISVPTEATIAMFGNFLVRERLRRILELAVPGACTFHPTADAKSKKPAPWWLAVPKQALAAPVPKAPPPFCPKCHEPMSWPRHQGEVWRKMTGFNSAGVDVFKTVDWRGGIGEDGVPPPPWTRLRLERDLYVSVRLEQLLKRAKVKGQLRGGILFDDVKPTEEDGAWIEDKFKLLTEYGLVDAPKTVGKSSATRRWFKQFLKRNAAKPGKSIDFATIETKQKLILPQDYKDFISKVGAKSFENVNDMEETLTDVLPPQKVDFKILRRGKMPEFVGEAAKVDGVLFATADFGDSFVFDVSVKNSDYPVYWYKHEESLLEPYAANFAECIKRFTQHN
jgi:hypothetical protein